MIIVVAVLAIAGLGTLATQVLAQGPWGWSRGAWSDPAQIDERVERMVKHFAIEVDATPAQQTRLTELGKAAARDLLPLRETMRSARRQATTLLTAATVDRAAVERLRVEQVQVLDRTSARVTQLLADVAEVLTPEQRQKIAAHIEQRAEHRRR